LELPSEADNPLAPASGIMLGALLGSIIWSLVFFAWELLH
jgi:hypothetical protein